MCRKGIFCHRKEISGVGKEFPDKYQPSPTKVLNKSGIERQFLDKPKLFPVKEFQFCFNVLEFLYNTCDILDKKDENLV